MSKSNISVGNQGWVDRINTAWRKAATAYIDIGNMLIESKAATPHGEWIDLLGKLDFDKRTAQKLMEIARDERLAKASELTLLPQHWTTLYALTRLGDDEFERALSVGGVTKQAKPRKPTVTEAEFYDVDGSGIPPQDHLTQSPGVLPEPGLAVSAEGGSEIPPLAPAEPVTPRGRSQGGDSDVIPDDGLQGHYPDSAAAHEALALADSPREGMALIWIDPHDPMSVFATGLMLAMDGASELNVAGAAVAWPENMPLLTEGLHDFADWLIEFEASFRALHGNGNAAALTNDAA
jgi:hypothetical protein